jgi:L-threonylcarbamoyladenylate synthase
VNDVSPDFITVDEHNTDEVAILAERLLRSGKLIIIPTETVYGVAAHPGVADGLAKLYRAKSRDRDKPIAFLAENLDAIRSCGADISATAEALASSFWPGPLTLVLPVNGGRTEGFRIPDHDITLAILQKCGGLLRVSSANESGSPDALTATDALEALSAHVDAVFDAGPAAGGTASTVVRVDRSDWEILREGAIPRETIENALHAAQPASSPRP